MGMINGAFESKRLLSSPMNIDDVLAKRVDLKDLMDCRRDKYKITGRPPGIRLSIRARS